jgi:hypothetical protein
MLKGQSLVLRSSRTFSIFCEGLPEHIRHCVRNRDSVVHSLGRLGWNPTSSSEEISSERDHSPRPIEII